MRFIEIQGSILQPISNEEDMLLEKVKGSKLPLPKESLTLRETEVARGLVHRGILTKVKMNNKLCYIANQLEEIWGE
jgi:hypothetical protein